jgi:hypothetical protein
MLLPIHTCFRSYVLTVIGLGTSLLVAVPVGAQLSTAIQSPTAPQPLPANWLGQSPSPNSDLNSGQSQSSTWQPFTSASGRYAVDFPATPTQFTSNTQVPEGRLTWQVAETRVQATEPNQTGSYEYYMIAYTTLSSDHLANHNLDELVQAISDAVLAEGGLNGTVQSQESVLFHDHPARLVIGSVGDQYWVMIVSLVDGRLYTNLAFSEQRDRVIHFFDSFTFTDYPT